MTLCPFGPSRLKTLSNPVLTANWLRNTGVVNSLVSANSSSQQFSMTLQWRCGIFDSVRFSAVLRFSPKAFINFAKFSANCIFSCEASTFWLDFVSTRGTFLYSSSLKGSSNDKTPLHVSALGDRFVDTNHKSSNPQLTNLQVHIFAVQKQKAWTKH